LEVIKIRGARTHNLKNLSLDLKLNKITCISGPSGSGKTSLAFHTLLTESKRRYLNSFPNDVKFFWDIPQTVDVDEIYPVLPVWGMAQHNPVVGSRPVVADLLGIHEELQKIFFLLGSPFCPTHKISLEKQSPVEQLMAVIESMMERSETAVIHLMLKPDDYRRTFGHQSTPSKTYDREKLEVSEYSESDPFWEFFKLKKKTLKSLKQRFETDFVKVDLKAIYLFNNESKDLVKTSFDSDHKCPECNYTIRRMLDSSHELSAYNPVGACSSCDGHGMNLIYDREKLVRDPKLTIREGAAYLVNYSRFIHYHSELIKAFKSEGLDPDTPFEKLPVKKWKILFEGKGRYPGFNSLLEYLEARKYKKNVRIYLRGLQKEVLCEACHGTRISALAQNIIISVLSKKFSFQEILISNIDYLRNFTETLLRELKGKKDILENEAASLRLLKKLEIKLAVCFSLRINHLKLTEKVRVLPPGEYQRILLTKFLSFEGSGSLLVLDEASLGLNLEEQRALLDELRKICDQGNTLLLIDHSPLVQSLADELILMGPEAGHRGGEIVYQGAPPSFKKGKSQTKKSPKASDAKIEFKGAEYNLSLNLQQINLIKGASSSLKNSLITKEIPQIIEQELNRDFKKKSTIPGLDQIHSFHFFDGSLGRVSSRSTFGTSTGFSQYVRKQFAKLPVSKTLDLTDGHFSSHSPLGQCPTCEGRGKRTIDMQFLEDLEFVCEDCKGMKLKPFYSSITNGEYSFYEMMSKSIDVVLPTIKLTPKYKRLYDMIERLNLNYIELDRSVSSLSGGERLRVKLLNHLQRESSHGLYFFENLSFGLGSSDLKKIAQFLEGLCQAGNTIVLIDESAEFEVYADSIQAL